MSILTPAGMDSVTGQFKIAGAKDTLALGASSLVTTIYKSTSIVTIANTSAETSTVGSGVGTKTLLANVLYPGNNIRIKGGGVYSAAAVAPGTLTLKVKVGSILVASTVLGSILSGASNLGFDVDVDLICLTVGVSGSFAVAGKISYTATALGGRLFGDLNNLGSLVTIDTTVDQTIDVTVAWQTASASNSVKVLQTLVTMQL